MIQHSRKHVKWAKHSSFNSAVYLTVVGCGEPVYLALGHLTALVLVSNKTGPARSQNSTQQAAVAEWT